MRPFQMRLRLLMILVAIVAIGLAGARVAKRAYFCRERARFFAHAEMQHRGWVDYHQKNEAFLAQQAADAEADPQVLAARGWDSRQQILASVVEGRRRAVREQKAAEVYATLVQQYERAMWRFWEPLPKDPDGQSSW